jgi:hypothetical protein
MELTQDDIRLLDGMDSNSANEWFKSRRDKFNNCVLDAAHRLYEADAAVFADVEVELLIAVEVSIAGKEAVNQAQREYFANRKAREKAARMTAHEVLLQRQAAKKKAAPQVRERQITGVLRKHNLPFPAALLPESVGKPTATDIALRSRGCVVQVNTGNIDYRLDKAKRHRR